MRPTPSPGDSQAGFPSTRWSWVAAVADPASPGAREGLEELAGAYWPPLYAFLRRKGYSPENAADLVQELFADLLERGDLRRLDRARGRLRSFLMACAEHLLAHRRDRDRAARRGGGRAPISLDAPRAEAMIDHALADDLTPERLYERQWALTLLERVLGRLDEEEGRPARRALYERLRPVLLGAEDAPTYRRIAEDLGMTEGAVKMAAKRLRDHYRALLRDEVERTVGDPAGVDEELGHMLAALAR